ncbi:hypothetical protein OAY00_00415 [Burkholderiales bacterium]|nr:hypothetical protein [Betaproteobacteria bacterium]MDA9295385.1 hypothetical protein [Burkholderiales bacterium]MDC3408204.1 hypothetical protein [Burkholderiales bacterium]
MSIATEFMRPFGIRLLTTANTLATLCLLVLAIGLTGGKLILYLIVAGLHTIFAVGIFMRQRWAYVLTITYALFQAVGMSLWCLIGVLTLLGEPATQEKIQFFILSGIVVPFLGWTIVYLLKRLRSDSFD